MPLPFPLLVVLSSDQRFSVLHLFREETTCVLFLVRLSQQCFNLCPLDLLTKLFLLIKELILLFSLQDLLYIVCCQRLLFVYNFREFSLEQISLRLVRFPVLYQLLLLLLLDSLQSSLLARLDTPFAASPTAAQQLARQTVEYRKVYQDKGNHNYES